MTESCQTVVFSRTVAHRPDNWKWNQTRR